MVAERMVLPGAQIRSVQARSLARVKLPDGTQQDFELVRVGAELEAESVEPEYGAAPTVVLDFTRSATPRATWTGREPPVAHALEIVARVCDALAREQRGEVAPVKRRRAREVASAVAPAVVALCTAFALGARAAPKPLPVLPAAMPGQVERAEPQLAPLPIPMDIPALPALPQPAHSSAMPELRARPFRVRVARTTVRHHLRGIPPGTGLVALRMQRGLEVSVDGGWLGLTPIRAISLDAGPHVLELRRSDDERVTRTLDLNVGDGDQTTLYLEVE